MKNAAGVMLGFALAIQAQDATSDKTADKAKLEAAQVKLQSLAARVDAAVARETFQFVGGQILSGKLVKGQPYSAEAVTESTQVLADGNRIVNRSSSMIYRDSEGRERREESIGRLGNWSSAGEPAKAVFISDPVAKVNYSLDAKSHTAIKSAAPQIFLEQHGAGGETITLSARGRGPAAPGGADTVYFENSRVERRSGGQPPKVEKLGTQVIEGVAADGTRTTITIPAGQIGNDREIQIVDERWISPELQVTVMSKHSDPRTGETVYKLTNVNRAEPLPSLFEVPADYTISEHGFGARRVITKDEN